MKHIILKVIAATIIVSCCHNEVKSQVSTPSNFSTNPNHFVGWNNNVTFPLEVRHDGFRPILFETFTQERMRIAEYGNVSIGNVPSVSAKLHVNLDNNNASFGLGPFRSYTIYGRNFCSGLSAENIAVLGQAQGTNEEEGDDNIGGQFFAQNAWRNIAVDGRVSHGTPGTNTVGELGWCMRVAASDHTESNIGIVARAAYGAGGGELVGISAGIDGAVGNPTEFAGAFQGDVQIWGDGFSNQGLLTSDEQFKTNIQSVEGALATLHQSHSSRTLMTS